MIVVAELQMQGQKHLQVNAGMLQILHLNFPLEEIALVCDDVHLKSMTPKLAQVKQLKPMFTFKFSNKEVKMKYWLFKTIREINTAFTLFRFARKNKVKTMVFLSIAPFTAPFINLMAVAFRQPIIACIHGDIGVLTYNKQKVTTSVYRSVLRFFFKHRNINFTGILFFSEIIKQNFFKLFPQFSSSNVIAIDHPYEYEQDNIFANVTKKPIKIANVGTALMLKNSHFLFELAEKCNQLIDAGKIQFTQIGNVSTEVYKYANSNVKILHHSGSFIHTVDFEKSLMEADYFVYFFTHGSYYDLCASGTFFDAIKYNKPIIALSNTFFDYYFEKLGNIGYLCNSLEEMKLVIEKITLDSNVEIYKQQIRNLNAAKELLSIKNITSDFSRQYSSIAL